MKAETTRQATLTANEDADVKSQVVAEDAGVDAEADVNAQVVAEGTVVGADENVRTANMDVDGDDPRIDPQQSHNHDIYPCIDPQHSQTHGTYTHIDPQQSHNHCMHIPTHTLSTTGAMAHAHVTDVKVLPNYNR